jgi:hypothetical protein
MALRAEPLPDGAPVPPAPVFIERIRQIVAQRDPSATFSQVYPAPDPGIWVMDAHVSPELASDLDFREELAAQEVDLMIEHGIHVATLVIDRGS